MFSCVTRTTTWDVTLFLKDSSVSYINKYNTYIIFWVLKFQTKQTFITIFKTVGLHHFTRQSFHWADECATTICSILTYYLSILMTVLLDKVDGIIGRSNSWSRLPMNIQIFKFTFTFLSYTHCCFRHLSTELVFLYPKVETWKLENVFWCR